MKRTQMWMMLAAMTLSGAVLAQQEEESRGVARLSLMNGDVSVKRGDSGDWVAGAINAPLLVEDRVLTGQGSRAEVQFDYYHRIRLAGDSEVRLSQLESKLYQIQVAKGLTTFNAIKGGDAQVEISTPGASLRPVAYGEYRVLVRPDGTAELTVRSGEAEIFTPTGTQKLRPGRTMVVRLGEANQSEYQFVAEVPRDSWDEFNHNRNKELQKGSGVYQYVSRDVYGAEDLNGHGDWVYVAPYGWSWTPNVAVGWSPYRYGRWVWADWYGWTWVSYDPWGWAPYHYGRWFYHGSRWCWYPGGMGMRHYWSPALVGWVGWSSWGGFSAGIGVGWGAVGWVPLAPFEPYHRWWGSGYYHGYRGGNVYNNTTIVNNVNITNVYRNSRVNNGVMAVNGNDFSRGYTGRPLRMGGEELSRASMAQGAVPVAPGRESLRMSERDAGVRGAEGRGAGNERFYSRSGSAARVDRVPFDEQRRGMEQVASRAMGGENGRGGANAGMNGIRQAEGSRGTAVSRSGEDVRGSSPNSQGWRRADESGRSGEARQGSGDWGRFGDPAVSSRSGNTGTGSRSAEAPAARSSEASGNGWRSFGNPGSRSGVTDANGGARSEPARSWTGGGGASGRSEGSRSMDTPRSDSGSRSWSTGGGAAGRSEGSRSMDMPRGDMGSRSGSTGGGAVGRSESPRMESPRMETPRMETPRGDTGSRSGSTGGGAAGRGEAPRMETPRSEAPASTGGGARSRGNSWSEPMSRGSWSTGGGSGIGVTDSSNRSGVASYGGESRSSASGYSGGGGRSTMSGPSTGFGGGGSMRSAPSPSFGGGGSMSGGMRSSPSFGGGGGMSGGARSAPSFGGGGGGSFGGGGGMRGGGGSMGGGGGHVSGGGGGSRGGGGGARGR
ncbi:MAG: FecR domain-containing protein [Acidobacteria bacterium]|nr:FecR domain-containing protein [Acidobacteriota bacterium]